MTFSTQIPISKSKDLIDYGSKIFGMGSCFAENMGTKFEAYKFQNLVNPFGIIFNVASILKIIKRTVNNDLFTEKDLFFNENRWHCFDVHSKNSHENQEILIENLNKTLFDSKNFISNATHIIITVGTSWVYQTIERQQIVANCYKLPHHHFNKKILSCDETIAYLQEIIFLIQSINPKANIIFTVSPVRHIKDGFFENNVSKGILLQAIFAIQQSNLAACYFPSYEIVMDELRDYRFFEADMLHPNHVAIDYIWVRFYQTYINDNCIEVSKKVIKIQKMLQHRQLDANANNIVALQNKIDHMIQNLKSTNPEIIF